MPLGHSCQCRRYASPGIRHAAKTPTLLLPRSAFGRGTSPYPPRSSGWPRPRNRRTTRTPKLARRPMDVPCQANRHRVEPFVDRGQAAFAVLGRNPGSTGWRTRSPPTRATASVGRTASNKHAPDMAQYLVTRGMAVGVVDALEPVQIDTGQDPGFIVSFRSRNRSSQDIVEAAPIQQSGQRIGHDQPLQLDDPSLLLLDRCVRGPMPPPGPRRLRPGARGIRARIAASGAETSGSRQSARMEIAGQQHSGVWVASRLPKMDKGFMECHGGGPLAWQNRLVSEEKQPSLPTKTAGNP